MKNIKKDTSQKINYYLINIILIILIVLIVLFLYNKLKHNSKTNYELFSSIIEKNDTEKQKPNKNLIFTSAGDNTQFYNHWLGENKNYDVWCVYYGKNDENYNMYEKVVDKIWKRKGSKFQNFHHIYTNYKDLLDNYDRFFIVDDDIVINTDDINKLFNISIQYDLWLCQPSYTSDSKISWKDTEHQPGNLLRYTNFTEVGTTVFSKYSINKFMEYYDPILIGWGIDLFYIWVLGEDKKDKYAIIDSIQCINPHDANKVVKIREHTNIENHNNEASYWGQIKNKYNIPEFTFKTYSTIKL
jgi:hypothetical protein